jgi:hypothetical protein
MPHKLTHEQNRVAIVNSGITKIFNPCKYLMVTIQHFRKTLNDSVPVLFITSFIVQVLLIQCFYWIQSFCLTIQCIFCSDTGIVFQVFRSHITTTTCQSINIGQCHLCLSIGSERPITVIDIEGYPEPISP